VYFVVVKMLVIVNWQCACQAGENLVIKGVNNENITVNHFAVVKFAIVYLTICTSPQFTLHFLTKHCCN
jgi:hypothetical protein